MRKMPRRVAAINARARTFASLWTALAAHLASGPERPRPRPVEPVQETPQVVVHQAKRIHPSLVGKPVLHLDATLRPELARAVLPQLHEETAEVAARQMSVTLVTRGFGKGNLCPGRDLRPTEAKRCANRRRDCIDYVRWQATRGSPGRVLVGTYKDIERAFAEIPGVSVAHFNAIAVLDAYREARLLIVIGCPLPSNHDLVAATAALYGSSVEGSYRPVKRGVRMRDGTGRPVRGGHRAYRYGADMLRAAICDDDMREQDCRDAAGRPHPRRRRAAAGA
jgi:hypothetical protein